MLLARALYKEGTDYSLIIIFIDRTIGAVYLILSLYRGLMLLSISDRILQDLELLVIHLY